MLLVLYYIWFTFFPLCYLYYIIFGLLSPLYVTCIILYLVYFLPFMLLVLYYILFTFSPLCYLYYIIFGLLSPLYVTCIILYLVYFDVDSIYPFELEIKDTTDIATSASYFGQHQEIDKEGTKLYDKKMISIFLFSLIYIATF